MILIFRLALSCALLFFVGSSWAVVGAASCQGPSSYTGTIGANASGCEWNGGDLNLSSGFTVTANGNTSPFSLGNSITGSNTPGVFTNSGTITAASNTIGISSLYIYSPTTGANSINNAGVIDSGSSYYSASAAIGIATGATLGGTSTYFATYTAPLLDPSTNPPNTPENLYSGSISSAIYNQIGAFIGQNATSGNQSEFGILNSGIIKGGTIVGQGNSNAIFNAGTIYGKSSAINNGNGSSITNSSAGNFYSAIANMNTGVIDGGISNYGNIGANADLLAEIYAIFNKGFIKAPTVGNYVGWAIYNGLNIGGADSAGYTQGIQNNYGQHFNGTTTTRTGYIEGVYNASTGYIGKISNGGGVISNSITNDGGRINGISNSFAGDYGEINSIINQSGGSITGQTGSATYGYAINNDQALITTGIDNQSGASIVGGISVTGFGSNVASINNAGTICAVTGGNTCTGSTSGNALNVGPIVSGSTPTIGAITNTGSITGGSGVSDYGIANAGKITTLTNTGSIAGTYGIQNSGTITTLNNLQSNLTYKGTLSTNYNIIINSPTAFGKLAVTSGTGSTAFGINTGSTVSNNHAYVGVLSGVTAGQVTNTSGTYGGYSWVLSLESGSSTIWDLIFGSLIPPVPPIPPGPSTADTQTSLANTASVLQNTFTLQNSILANSFTYDCELFDVNNICVSAGGRNTAVSTANGLNNTSALLIAAYRPHPNYRIGAYADQNLSVNNAGSTVNLGNNTPLLGLFGAWNERLDGTGTEVKVSAAYGQKNASVTRSVVGTGATASEAGSGSSQLNSQGAQVTAKYGFGVMDTVIVSPYVGIRYTQNNMGGYTEGTSATVTAPLTYSALNTNATTALAGVGASYKFIPQAMLFASAGVETDTNTANGTYAATGVTGLTPINFNANPVKTRPTATVGAYYDLVKNQRLGVTGIYRQEPYQAVQTTTVMATYTIGL